MMFMTRGEEGRPDVLCPVPSYQASTAVRDSGKRSKDSPARVEVGQKVARLDHSTATQQADLSAEDLFSVSVSESVFDMSSRIENIFLDASQSQQKEDEEDAGEEVLESMRFTPEESLVATPRFRICSENLDLHWSDSDNSIVLGDSEGEQQQEVEDVLASRESSVLASRVELSVGMELALENLGSEEEFAEEGKKEVSKLGATARLKSSRRRRKRARAPSPVQLILSDDSEPEETKEVKIEDSQDAEECPASLAVVEVCNSKEVWRSFLAEWAEQPAYSLAVGVAEGKVAGLAVCWGRGEVYWAALGDGYSQHSGLLQVHRSVNQLQIEMLRGSLRDAQVLSTPGRGAAVDWRLQARLLHSSLGGTPGSPGCDPSVAAWLLDPASPAPPTLASLAVNHAPALLPLLARLGSAPGRGSVAASPAPGLAAPPRTRACCEAALVWELRPALHRVLASRALLQHYREVELPCQAVLLGLELAGAGLHTERAASLVTLLQARTRQVEDEAHKLAGKPFSLTSPQQVCCVLSSATLA